MRPTLHTFNLARVYFHQIFPISVWKDCKAGCVSVGSLAFDAIVPKVEGPADEATGPVPETFGRSCSNQRLLARASRDSDGWRCRNLGNSDGGSGRHDASACCCVRTDGDSLSESGCNSICLRGHVEFESSRDIHTSRERFGVEPGCAANEGRCRASIIGEDRGNGCENGSQDWNT